MELVKWRREAAAVLLGAAWNTGTLGVALSPLSVVLWRTAESRRAASNLALCYYSGAVLPGLCCLGLQGYGRTSSLELIAAACVAVAVAVAPWAALWSQGLRRRPWATLLRTYAILGCSAAPVLGIVGIANPLTAAGLWFPGCGWWGLVLLSTCAAQCRPLTLFVLGSLSALGASQVPSEAGIQTALPTASEPDDYLRQFEVADAAMEMLPRGSDLVVLGEGIGGLWSATMRELWTHVADRTRAEEQALVLGATVPTYDEGRRTLHNAAIVFDARGVRISFQRAPVPYVMWRPWDDDNAYVAHWSASGVMDTTAGALGIAICYEQLLTWPILQSFAHGADKLVAISNLHGLGAAAPLVDRWQRAAVLSWGELFGVPVAFGTNH